MTWEPGDLESPPAVTILSETVYCLIGLGLSLLICEKGPWGGVRSAEAFIPAPSLGASIMNLTSQAQGQPPMSSSGLHGQEAGGLSNGAEAVAVATPACSLAYPPHPSALVALSRVPSQPGCCRRTRRAEADTHPADTAASPTPSQGWRERDADAPALAQSAVSVNTGGGSVQ